MATISISKNKVEKSGGLVILTIQEYQKLRELAVPTYHLKGKSAQKLDKLVNEGLKEYRKGKAKSIKSLSDLD